MIDDFLTHLDQRERQTVVLLRSGYTTLDEVATIPGNKTHSPASR